MSAFRPMLASDAVLDSLQFPILASAKLDGIRAIVKDGVVLSRSLKPIPNKYVQQQFGQYEHFDGELIVGSPTSKSCYRDTVSEVMSHDKTNGATLYAFDHIADPAAPYAKRHDAVTASANVIKHEQMWCKNLRDVLTYEEHCLDLGYEGLILRAPDGVYKFGRSRPSDGLLAKLKRFTDAEFEVIGYEERMHNANEATTNELGRTARSSHKAGKVGLGDLGALVLQGDGFTFSVGTGFDDATRKALWEIRDGDLVGRLAKIKYFAVGMKTAPRHPVFLGFRDGRDL